MSTQQHIIDKDRYDFTFSKSISPVLEAESGDEIIFNTRDAHNGTVPDGTDVQFPNLDLKECNPVTGPVYIKNATPGDTLMVKIKDIKLDSKGFVPCRPDMGIIKGVVSKELARNLDVEDGVINFSDEIKIPIRPMVGTIGIAPPEGEIFSAYAGVHGGNMDNNDVKIGSKIYFPVFAEGALLSIGDVHASMGDGELTSGGIDICAEVLVEVDLVKGKKINRPIIETKDSVIVTSNAVNFYEANKTAALEMIDLLTDLLEVNPVEAYWLISICGDLKISQAFNNSDLGLTLRLSFPKIGKLSGKKRIF